jgi:hypothetical protein
VKPPSVALIFCSESTWAPRPTFDDIANPATAPIAAIIQPFEAQRMVRTLLDHRRTRTRVKRRVQSTAA